MTVRAHFGIVNFYDSYCNMADNFYQELTKYYATKLNKVPLKKAEIEEIIETIHKAKTDKYVLYLYLHIL